MCDTEFDYKTTGWVALFGDKILQDVSLLTLAGKLKKFSQLFEKIISLPAISKYST